jgi:hypothetical protein
MVTNCVERGTHAQAGCRTKKETGEYEYILPCGGLISRFELVIEGVRADQGGDGTEEVRPYIHSFVMQVAQAGDYKYWLI